jgi:hypothetical protein
MNARSSSALAAALLLVATVTITSSCVLVWTPDCPGGCNEDGGSFDDDGDGLTNDEEAGFGTDPEEFDSDGDGESDAVEVACGSDANWSSETCPDVIDSDDDGRTDAEETDRGTDPLKPDTDNDGWTDNEENGCDSSPLDPQVTCDSGEAEAEQQATVCWWIGDWLAHGNVCTLYADNIYIEEMPAEGCAPVVGDVYILCETADGEESCACEAQAGDDVIVDEDGCP